LALPTGEEPEVLTEFHYIANYLRCAARSTSLYRSSILKIYWTSNMMLGATTRTTITLPAALLAATDQAVTAGKAKNRNELIARAIPRELALIRRAEIDADLSEMSQDAEYQVEVLQMEAEFAVAQWEALQTIET
jgi:regulator of protease activity HflC (stomatin/prohibitin superfamily)